MNKRVTDFKKLGLGLFIHYGLYSFYEKGEWYWEMNHLSEFDYYTNKSKSIKLEPNFKEILPLAKEAGFNYSVLTSKHHDGFALYDSKGNSKYDINWLYDCEDIVDNFINECEKNNIKPFLYYATMEWIEYKFDDHIDNIYLNIKYLLNKYGDRICGFWFDGNWSKPDKNWKLDELYGLIRKINNKCIIINNTGLEEKGKIIHKEIDSVTFEQGSNEKIFKFDNNKLAFEVCYPINDHWGFSKNDYNYKSFKKILSDLIYTRTNGGNLLLNIGLDSKGKIGIYERSILNLLRNWNKNNNYFLTGNIRKISQDNDDLIVIVNETTDKKYLIIKNLISGAHIDNIHYGRKNKKFILNIFWENIKEIFNISSKEFIKFNIKNNKLELYVDSFEYGTNEIFKILEVI